MMRSPYVDNPANSVTDFQKYYDEPTLPLPPGASQDIPLTSTSFSMQQNNNADASYAPLEQPAGYNYPSNQWTEANKASNKRAKLITIGLASLLLVLVATGVSVGVVVSRHSSRHNASVNGGPNSNSSSGPPSVNQTDPNDPSTFVPDPRLKKSFYGFAYEPENVQTPDCGATLSQVITDIQLLSQLTGRIRLYGADCNQSALVLEAIKQTKVDMQVYLGNYNLPDDNHTAYNRQKLVIQNALQTYGTDHIGGITVGNEFMLNYLTENNEQNPNSAIGNTGAAILIQDIKDTRQMLATMGLTSKVPVGNSDAGAYFNNLVLEAIDYGLSNVHPWFGGVSINDAAGWTWEFFTDNNVQPAALLPNHPQMYIAETGWPTASNGSATSSDGASIASEGNLQIFLDTFVCQANQNATKYFYFEYFDETWKDIEFGGVEGHWGIFYANRTLKGITIPDCPSP